LELLYYLIIVKWIIFIYKYIGIDLLDDFKEQIEEIFAEVRKGIQTELPTITSGPERIEVNATFD